MMSLIFINTQEWLRLKFLQVVFFLAFIYICMSSLLGTLSFTEQVRIKYDFGLAGLEIAALLIAAFISTHALDRDIERKTFQIILARPIARWHLLVGYLGSILVLNAILVVLMSLTMALFFNLDGHGFNLFIIAMTILIKSIVLGAFGLALSTMARPMLSLALTISYWLLMYSVPDIRYFIQKMEFPVLTGFGQSLDYILPRFYLFNWKSYRDLQYNFNSHEIIWSWFHCFGWIFLLLFVAALCFRKKDIF